MRKIIQSQKRSMKRFKFFILSFVICLAVGAFFDQAVLGVLIGLIIGLLLLGDLRRIKQGK